ncbi:CGNR zinc finger domain-containing protein [Amycolatopsis sp. H20-H5]|uniref:CGNR zinc finger domain-containing protein n=1 Tax=Amycolatopsis sp. H20-H5 TaxID=3046309 RepID=UPI002DBDCB66|nr:CGNR zinc finger domain-containing protein [Amycolatopsis sp. H20-H5]MEC3976819.1 CGNR zinc finger domain-containing protein [Amycolatopsis sp. H20-H5]
MHFNPYGGSAAQVAAELANLTSDDPVAMAAMMHGHGMTLHRLDQHEAAAIAAWGLRLREVFAAPAADGQADLLNRLLSDSACRPYISRHDGRVAHLHYASEHADPVSRVRAYTAGGLAHLVCDEPGRLGACGREGCGIVYVDVSRNGKRRYCSTRCATRVHVAEHRDRARQAG